MKQRDIRLSCAVFTLVITSATLLWALDQMFGPSNRNLSLVTAIQQLDVASVASLLKQGADPNSRFVVLSPSTKDADSSLGLAPFRGTLNEIVLSVFQGQPRKTDYGEPCLLELLADERMDVRSSAHPFGDQPSAYPEIVKMMLEHGADPNAADQFGQTALHYAVWSDNPQVSILLLQHGADPNRTYGRGDTPLGFAVFSHDADLVRVLLEYHANPNVKDSANRTMLQLAGNSQAVIRLLRRYGAKR